MNDIENIFLEILRSAIKTDKTIDSVKLTDNQWQRLFKISKDQGLAAMTFDEVMTHENNMPFGLKMEWAFHTDRIKERHEQQIVVTQKLAGFLKEHNVKMMLLKGNGLALLYPKPELRECGDIDISCFGDYDKVNQLVAARGIEVEGEDTKHSHFYVDEILVENHKMFNYESNKANKVVSRELMAHFDENPLTDERIPNVYFANPNVNALYVTMHMLNHMPWSGLPFRMLVDWTLFFKANNDKIDWTYLEKIWKESGLIHAIAIIAEVCQRNLGCRWFNLDLKEYFDESDYQYVMHNILNQWKQSSMTNNKFKKVMRKIDQYNRRKKMHFIVYQVKFPDTLIGTLWRYVFA